ncbi:hypothetical protein ED733_006267 [Metarhizium rileyi]|uniref:BTB domain transcription factor n=1 Tax=Metarhizium rileyi (strain RCEF 4871) TaxID=1649241 RepID=A0A5C6GI75_METRR|nr:hypothetical protein ED733_006267 [Metarhizium rileyi]
MPTTRSGKTISVPAHAGPEKKKQKVDANDRSRSKKPARDNQKQQNEAKSAKIKTPEKPVAKKTANRDKTTPSNVLERGVMYYFIRGRVDVDTPKTVSDIARGYIILRPMASDAKLGRGLPATATCRLIALPKKTLPASPKDRFMAFVEKSGASYDKLREEFLKGRDYETKTAGHRHSPDATPVGEGVYAITTTGRESHLSYMATLPEEMGELQRALRFDTKGSFIVSSKNPAYKGPASARLPEGPEYPPKVLEKFKGLRWVGAQPEFLDYPRAQMLLIGHKTGLGKEDGSDGEGEGDGDGNGDGDDVVDVLSELEEQDVERMRHLSTDESDAIYADLQSRKMAHPKIQKDF